MNTNEANEKKGCADWVYLICFCGDSLTLKVPEKLQLYGLYVYYVVHICDIGMLRVNIEIQVLIWIELHCCFGANIHGYDGILCAHICSKLFNDLIF